MRTNEATRRDHVDLIARGQSIWRVEFVADPDGISDQQTNETTEFGIEMRVCK